MLTRLGVYGDLPTRFLEWGVRIAPLYLEPLFIAAYALLGFLGCGAARRAIAANLAVILPGTTPLGNRFRALRVFWNFAWVCADGARSRFEGACLDWEIVGMDHFRELAGSDGPAIVLTAHMGSYDVAAPFFARRFGRRFHAVRAPERTARLQALREGQSTESDAFKIHFNHAEAFTGVELLAALRNGEVVGLQGDRVILGITPVTTEFFGRLVQMPKGPFALALATGAPIYPLFVVRLGLRRYQIRVGEAIACHRTQKESDPDILRAARAWSSALASIVRPHWDQWFVFEPVFPEAEEDLGTCATASI